MHPLDLRLKKQNGQKIVSLTAYDYGTAKLLDQAGVVDFILVGDSLGMVVLGYPDTLSVTMEDMLHHLKAVTRGVSQTMVVVDMPFLSVHTDFTLAIQNAGRMMQEGRAQAVKIEGASLFTLEVIEHLTEIGIPVMGHLGLTPQSIQTLGGYKVQGKTMSAVKQLVEDAMALEAAGVFAVVLEMLPWEVAALVSEVVSVPTIGIGSGAACDGQILVIDDFIGKFPDFKPRFVRTYGQFAEMLTTATQEYAVDIHAGLFPNAASESVHFPASELDQLRAYQADLVAERQEETVSRVLLVQD